jgi:hypothetical protein
VALVMEGQAETAATVEEGPEGEPLPELAEDGLPAEAPEASAGDAEAVSDEDAAAPDEDVPQGEPDDAG